MPFKPDLRSKVDFILQIVIIKKIWINTWKSSWTQVSWWSQFEESEKELSCSCLDISSLSVSPIWFNKKFKNSWASCCSTLSKASFSFFNMFTNLLGLTGALRRFTDNWWNKSARLDSKVPSVFLEVLRYSRTRSRNGSQKYKA